MAFEYAFVVRWGINIEMYHQCIALVLLSVTVKEC